MIDWNESTGAKRKERSGGKEWNEGEDKSKNWLEEKYKK